MTHPEQRPAITLDGLSKSYGRVRAVVDVNAQIREGEFFSLLGPSGCGKTTTLRMMAGFEFPDTGSIHLRGDDVTWTPPNRRAVNMVFQRYELFPHMTVFENVAYGLKLKKVPKAEIRQRAMEMLEIVGVGSLGDRGADQLSGGQQQRVALARALVNQPTVLLLDEPLSALDVNLRKRMQLELKSIQEELGTTFVYVTHDQEEALSMSDRIGIMNEGRLLQVGTPREIYEKPVNTFVADFVGTLNDFEFRVERVDGQWALMGPAPGHTVRVMTDGQHGPGDTLRAAIRPEKVSIGADVAGDVSSSPGKVTDTIYLGPTTQYLIATPLGEMVAQTVSDTMQATLSPGQEVVVSWAPEAAFILDTGESTRVSENLGSAPSRESGS